MNFSQKREYIKKEKRLDKVHYSIIIVLMIFALYQYFFLQENTIGGLDDMYLRYILLIPVISGMFILSIYRFKYVKNVLMIKEDIISKLIGVGFLILQGALISYICFGVTAHSLWNYINKNKTQENLTEKFDCNILEFRDGKKKDIIWFDFKGEKEQISVSYSFIKKYLNKDVNDYKISLELKKGIWDNYIIVNFSIKNVR